MLIALALISGVLTGPIASFKTDNLQGTQVCNFIVYNQWDSVTFRAYTAPGTVIEWPFGPESGPIFPGGVRWTSECPVTINGQQQIAEIGLLQTIWRGMKSFVLRKKFR